MTDIAALPYEEVLMTVQSRIEGLTEEEIRTRHALYGLNTFKTHGTNLHTIIFRQFTSNPLIAILALATGVSFVFGQHISSVYISIMILVSVVLGFWNEYSAEKTVQLLLKKISPKALVVRNGEKIEIPAKELTIGDIVIVARGNIVPADIRLITSKNIEADESSLTGESRASVKTSASILFMGTTIVNGVGKGVVVQIGLKTRYGSIAQKASYAKPQTDFEKGLSQFGRLLVNVILILTVCIFVINALLGRPVLESLLFALAIAVGLTPELLPVIVTVSLSHGAGKLSKKKVIAKQLVAIENLGNMDILCTDKTGTLTEGDIALVDYIDMNGEKNPQILLDGLLCASSFLHHRGNRGDIDASIWLYAQKNTVVIPSTFVRIIEEPFDYDLKAMYTVVEHEHKRTIIVKGAPEALAKRLVGVDTKSFLEKVQTMNDEGFRVIAIAKKEIDTKNEYSWDDTSNLSFEGFIRFLDMPKVSAKEALIKLHALHVIVKIITGDNETITQKVCRDVGMDVMGIVLGEQIEVMTDEDLRKKVMDTTIFAKVTPEQKIRIIKIFQSMGHVVGFLGDGVNDTLSLKGADVGISVDTAVDVAKDASSIVLLHKGLDVIADGVIEGRKTFSNTIKYILMGTSSNFGNMISASLASFFLPFLPMTPLQILLTNGLYDISQLSIPTDNVDHESLLKPRKWNISFIKHYMIFFGPISSLYDILTFGVMLFFFHAQGPLFQTGWFIESIATEILVVFVIRTSKTPFFLSRPSMWLLGTCLGIVTFGILLPFSPLASHFGFISPPPLYFIILIILVSTYLLLVEGVKTIFLKKYSL